MKLFFKCISVLVFFIIFSFFIKNQVFADCQCDSGGLWRVGGYCYGLTWGGGAPSMTCLCACSPGGGGGGDTTPPAVVGGYVIAEGETGGTSNLAGPDGTITGPYGGYCVEPKAWSCSNSSGSCAVDYRCDGDNGHLYPWRNCDSTTGTTGDYRSYGVTGTNTLVVKRNDLSPDLWYSTVSVSGGKIEKGGWDAQCSGDCGDDTFGRPCIYTSGGPYFKFNSFKANQTNTFTINTSTTDGFSPVSMNLTGATTASVTCTGGTTCSLTATLNAGGHNLAIVIKKSDKATILGRIQNQAKIDNGISDNLIENPEIAACDTAVNEVVDVTVGIAGKTNVTVKPDQCIANYPAYAREVEVDLNGKYTVTANVPFGWEAVGWACSSVLAGVVGGTSCPNSGGTGVVSASGTGAVVSNVPLKKDEQAHIWFYIRPIAPTCTMSNVPSSVVAGESLLISALANVPGAVATGRLFKIDSKTLQDPSLNVGICSANNTCTVLPYTLQTTISDIGKTYYAYCRGWNDGRRECRPFSYGAYPADLDCDSDTGANKVGACPDNDCKTVTVTAPGSWFQTWGGDVHSEDIVKSYVPSTMTAAYQFFNLNTDPLNIASTYPGLISYKTSYDFWSDGTEKGQTRSSVNKWLANSAFSPSVLSGKTIYESYYQKLNSPTVDNFSCSDAGSACPTPSAGITTYYSADSVTISGTNSWSIPSSSKVIVLINGDLNISLDTNQRITVAPGGFLAFIVKGNINIGGQVGNSVTGYGIVPFLQGVYLADGTVGTTGVSALRFIGLGIFYGKMGVNLGRDLGNACAGMCNANTPAELFTFNPDLVINSPYDLWTSKIDWQEVVP